LRRFIFMRYQAQVHELAVEVPLRPLSVADEQELAERFLQRYTSMYGENSAFSAAGHELLTFRVEATIESSKPSLARRRDGADAGGAGGGTRRMYLGPEQGFVDGDVYAGERLGPGCEFAGPAVIERYGDAVVVRPGVAVRIDELNNIVISINGGS